REQQWTKYVILDLFAELSPAPVVISGAIESLVFDKKRMVDLMRHDYLEAADAADHLAQSRGVPFRTAYRWLGEAVRVSEERKISLAEAINEVLTREKDTRPLDESEIKLLSTPEALVARRTSNGGPSPDAVKEQLTLLNAKMGTARLRVRKYRSSVEKGRSLLAAAMKKHS
ncbi:TPA: hypothetical protein DDW35_13185, partial [Candidatus Sumerlaeota bacterium]|nr:hypothetical protein [Candidatus Sumerlaeota bacterium]